PRTAPQIKKNAVGDYGGEIIYCEPTFEERERVCNEVMEKTGAIFVHPFNDYRIIRGQATAALEILDRIENLDYIIPPIGGGGLSSGTALTTHYVSPNTKVIAAEPKEADDAYRSLRDGKIYPSVNPDTIADGLRTCLGDKTFHVVSKYVNEIITVEEDTIVHAMRTVWERMKIIIEPSAAVTLAAVMENKEKFAGKRVCLIFTGGNVDLDKLPWL
ncbi:threonine/serine dehydratase, partial [Bacteroidota bacterium]